MNGVPSLEQLHMTSPYSYKPPMIVQCVRYNFSHVTLLTLIKHSAKFKDSNFTRLNFLKFKKILNRMELVFFNRRSWTLDCQHYLQILKLYIIKFNSLQVKDFMVMAIKLKIPILTLCSQLNYISINISGSILYTLIYI